MRKIAFNQICTLSLEFKNPERAKLVMRVFLESSLAHARCTVTKNLLQRFCAKKLVFKDVKTAVNSITGKLKSDLSKDSLLFVEAMYYSAIKKLFP